MRIMRYPIFFVSVLFLLSACNKKQTKETPYMDRAEELFAEFNLQMQQNSD